jgi:hypothetical protein
MRNTIQGWIYQPKGPPNLHISSNIWQVKSKVQLICAIYLMIKQIASATIGI